ncbi:MAG: enoyl-CoA hydratase/isomerase family protein [Acidobacteria bacterium]|nr:enoyl-CoA hydratase/isomerase family protein [Acidobacteriota bacterium]
MNEDAVRVTEEEGFVHLVLDRGANVMDEEMLLSFRRAVAVAREAGAPPLLLSSANPRIFCPGWDLKRLSGAVRDDVARFLRLFESAVLDFFSYPGPTVVAIGGHAIAGGCLLALAGDRRVVSRGARMGLSEINLGVPVPAGCVRMLTSRLAPHAAEELVLQGDGCTPQRALELGIVQRIVEAGELAGVVRRDLATLHSKSACAYAEAKRLLHGQAWEAARRQAEAGADAFLRCWFDPDTQDRIGRLVQRLRR